MLDTIYSLMPQILTFVGGTLCGFFGILWTRQKALVKGVRVLLKIELRRMYDNGTAHNNTLSYGDGTLADDIYTAYHGLGGNGQGTAIIEDIRRMKKCK